MANLLARGVAGLAAVSAGLLVVALAPVGIAHAAGTFNVRTYGAKGNGSTLDDDAIDKAINAANAAGGGIVLFPKGTYKSRSIHLKSDVTLQLDPGSTIRAASSGFDAPEANAFSKYQDFGHSHFHDSLLWGDGITNVAITGTGTIDGDGLVTDNAVPKGKGDKILALTRCTNVTLRGVTFKRGGHFAVLMNGCHDLLLDSVKVLTTTDRDAVNLINSWNVEVAHSDIEGDDDALAFKSDFALGRTFVSENLYVHDSKIVSTKNNALQFGVETCGDYRNGRFEDLQITGAGKAGIGILSIDGAHVTDLHFARVTMNRVSSPIFMKIGGRGSCPGTPPPGKISGISFTDITGTNLTTPLPVQGAPEYASTITGAPGDDIEDVSLTNIKLTVPGGHSVADADRVPPESLVDYRPRDYGTRPAYGFWLRHVTRVTFVNTEVQFDKNDGRPAFAVDASTSVSWTGARVQRSTGPVDLRVGDTAGYAIADSTITTGAALRIKAVNSTPS
jgi:polygalacturonase